MTSSAQAMSFTAGQCVLFVDLIYKQCMLLSIQRAELVPALSEGLLSTVFIRYKKLPAENE